jgi:hypothetical protein
MTQTIEDVIFKISELTLTDTDKPVLTSLYSQLMRNVFLTDRQYELAKEKLVNYRSELVEAGIIDLDRAMSTLGKPLRQIDRTKTISIVDASTTPDLASRKSHRQSKWIKIDFPFNKKTIAAIGEMLRSGPDSPIIGRNDDYYHPKGGKSHYFAFNERNAKKVVDVFVDRNFDIEQELIDMAEEIEKILSNKSSYVPGVYNGKILNLKSNAVDLINKEVDINDPNRTLKLCDRRFRYGLGHVDVDVDVLDPIISEILNRDSMVVNLLPETHSFDNIAKSIVTLDRFPILVLVDEARALEQVTMIHSAFSDTRNREQAVLFRVAASTAPNVNSYIRDHQLNNWVDETTKIVYININKLPKVLLTSNWKPSCTVEFCVQRNSYVRAYTAQHSDLVIRLGKELRFK